MPGTLSWPAATTITKLILAAVKGEHGRATVDQRILEFDREGSRGSMPGPPLGLKTDLFQRELTSPPAVGGIARRPRSLTAAFGIAPPNAYNARPLLSYHSPRLMSS